MLSARNISGICAMVFTLAGCVTATEEEDEDTDGGWTTRQPASATATLTEAAKPSARQSICATLDSRGDVRTLDEFPCEVQVDRCMPDQCHWISCGGCVLQIDRDHRGPAILEAQLDSSPACEVFAGTYQLAPHASCEAPSE